jgi:hypothetical protein
MHNSVELKSHKCKDIFSRDMHNNNNVMNLWQVSSFVWF